MAANFTGKGHTVVVVDSGAGTYYHESNVIYDHDFADGDDDGRDPRIFSHGAQVADVVTGPGQLSLAEGEFVVEFEIDDPPANTGDAYIRMTPRTEMDIAIVGAAVRVTMDGDTCTDARVVLGAVAPTAVRVPDAEAALIGSSLDEAALAEVAAAASAAANPINDKRGTIEYRVQVAGVLAKRAAVLAAERARA